MTDAFFRPQDVAQLAIFVELIFGRAPAFCELRALPGVGNGKYAREWVEPQRLIERAAALLLADIDIRVGPIPRRIGCGSAQDITALTAHWVDIDRSPEEAFAALAGKPTPTLVVGTGRGVHAYWVFEQPLPATQQNVADWYKLQHALTACLGGDPMARDSVHMLRFPGTFNSKRGRRVQILTSDMRCYPETLRSRLAVSPAFRDAWARAAPKRAAVNGLSAGQALLQTLLNVSYTTPRERSGSTLIRLAVCPACLDSTGVSEASTAWIDFAGNLRCWRASCSAGGRGAGALIPSAWIPQAIQRGLLRPPELPADALYRLLDFGATTTENNSGRS